MQRPAASATQVGEAPSCFPPLPPTPPLDPHHLTSIAGRRPCSHPTHAPYKTELLYEAKYGERGPDGKMTPEQYAALRRKIGGTARDYWKSWVEEEQVKNIKAWSKPDEAAAVPFLPFLVGTILAMLVTTVLVVEKTA